MYLVIKHQNITLHARIEDTNGKVCYFFGQYLFLGENDHSQLP